MAIIFNFACAQSRRFGNSLFFVGSARAVVACYDFWPFSNFACAQSRRFGNSLFLLVPHAPLLRATIFGFWRKYYVNPVTGYASGLSVSGVSPCAVFCPHLTQDDVQDRLQVTAVCDPVPGRAQAASEKFNVPYAYETYEALLADGHVDAVSIASPIGLHYEQGKLAIEHGLHAHFNKTMTTTVDEADDLIESAARKGVKLVASPGEMLRPIHQEIRQPYC